MSTKKKMFLAIAGGLLALGLVLAELGFAFSGFNPRVFTVHLDTRTNEFILGGVSVEDPSRLPFVDTLKNMGEISLFMPAD